MRQRQLATWGQSDDPTSRQRGRVSKVTVVTPVPIIQVRRRKPLNANGLQFNHRSQRFMPVILVRTLKSRQGKEIYLVARFSPRWCRARLALIVLAACEMVCGHLMVTNKWFGLLTRGTEVPT